MSLFVVDFEAFKGKDGEIVVKELSLLPVSGGRLRTWTFKPPYPWTALPQEVRKTNRWILHHMHGIHWNVGKAAYRDLAYTLVMALPEDAVVYVKGYEKAQFVSSLIGHRLVMELEGVGCPRTEDIECPTPGCSNHATVHCSRVKAVKFAFWCAHNLMFLQ